MRAPLFPLVALCLALAPQTVHAQEDDRSYLVALLEDNLSDAGRKITITGFEGALSSVASLDEMTIADDLGVWITLRDVSLDWSRSALLSGEVSVNSLTAAEIILDRMPDSGASSLPAAEAAPFALPDLPVSVRIDKIAAEKIVLGAGILGETVEGRVAATVSLVGGEGRVTFNLDRLDDGPAGFLTLDASYSNATSQLTLSLDAQEDEGGIAARLLSVPGAPSAGLTIEGSGPLDDFLAEVSLQTGGLQRLSGQVELRGQADGARNFAVDLKGDLAPVFWPEYRDFLGEALVLKAAGTSRADGRLELSEFALKAGALNAKGQLSLAADGLPERFLMALDITGDGATPLLLPLTTEVETRITAAQLNLGFDAAQSDAWSIGGLISGLDRADFKAQSLSLSGGGNIGRAASGRQISAGLSFIGLGLTPADAALAKALGQTVSGKLQANWQEGSGQTELTDLSLTGEVYTLKASGAVQGLASGFAFGGRVQGDWADLAVLQDLTGMPLAGQAGLSLSGTASALGDAFDLRFAADGRDLRIGIAQIDRLMTGTSRLAGQVNRGAAGTALRDISVEAGNLRARLNGTLTSAAVTVSADLSLPDLSALDPGYRGSISGAASYVGAGLDGVLTLTGKGDGLGIGQAEIDRVLAGPANLAVTVAVSGGAPQLKSAILAGQSLDLTATGAADGQIDIQAQLANLGLILPDFPGALTLAGLLRQGEEGTALDLTLKGPAQVTGRLTGTIAPSYDRAALTFAGQSLAEVLNPILKPRALSGRLSYDLQLNGPLALTSVSGGVLLSGARLADPSFAFGMEAIDARIDLSGGQARIDVDSRVTTGGSVSVSGGAQLTAPFQGNLAVTLSSVTLRQPSLFETLLNGRLSVDGPLAGGAVISGQVNLGRTELRVPSGGVSGAEAVPVIRHLSEPAEVRATRERAGLTAEAEAGKGGSGKYLLDVTVTAPNQIFLRGRGIDAELGGSFLLSGTTAEIIPQGSFDLIRGRLDLVGRRLTLTEAQVALQGDFVPRIYIVASVEDTDILSTIRISGPATDPVLTFESSPELPDEEVMAQLLFGAQLQALSALQAAQLATAVNTLAGRGGEGLVNKIRRRTGLDNLDITTSDTEGTSLTAGKYLSDKIYTEVTIGQTGKTQIDLTFDVRPHTTIKGNMDSDGESGVGIYLEKNY